MDMMRREVLSLIVAQLLGSTCLKARAFGIFGGSPILPQTDLPEGVLAKFEWGSRRIPVSDVGSRDTQVLDVAVDAVMHKYGIVGCGICVVRDAQIVYSRGFGFSELPETPFTSSTASRCGSLAKCITSLSALTLLDDGKLDLDAKILPILKSTGIVPKPVGSSQIDERLGRIRVRHLMDHTSGLPSGATYTAWRPNRNVVEAQGLDHIPTGADVVADALGNFSLDSEPGVKYQYANANFVILARIVEAASGRPFSEYVTRVAMPRFGLTASDIYVSRNQTSSSGTGRGDNEAAYYQTSNERYVSFVPSEQSKGKVYGEAYHGYATESSDGAGGIACTAHAIGNIIANLHSAQQAISPKAIREILTPPEHFTREAAFDPAKSEYYSKGFNVRYYGGRPWLSHGGMTNHCGGVIGHNAGYQFVAVSNWNNSQQPYVDSILDQAKDKPVSML